MINSKEQKSQKTKLGQRAANSAGDGNAQAESLLTRNRALSEHAAELDMLSVEKQYLSALASHVESKQEQARRIEGKLEYLIEEQSSRLQQSMAQQPRLIALPGSRARWQQQVQQQQANLQRLHGRLELVREMREGMGLHANNIEDLAARKLRFADPCLADEWDEQQAALRHRLAVQRKKPHGQRQAQGTPDERGWSLSNTISIDHPN